MGKPGLINPLLSQWKDKVASLKPNGKIVESFKKVDKGFEYKGKKEREKMNRDDYSYRLDGLFLPHDESKIAVTDVLTITFQCTEGKLFKPSQLCGIKIEYTLKFHNGKYVIKDDMMERLSFANATLKENGLFPIRCFQPLDNKSVINGLSLKHDVYHDFVVIIEGHYDVKTSYDNWGLSEEGLKNVFNKQIVGGFLDKIKWIFENAAIKVVNVLK